MSVDREALAARCLHFEPLADSLIVHGSTLSAATRSQLRRWCAELAERVRSEAAYHAKHGRCVYVGLAGMAWALYAAARALADERLAAVAETVLDFRGGHDITGVASFLTGETGSLLVSALVRPAQAESDIAHFLELASEADKKEDFDDEWLYGRAGLLIGCLMLVPQAASTGNAEVVDRVADQLAQHLLERGQAQSSAAVAWKTRKTTGLGGVPPLLYSWHSHFYTGAAHGLLGVVMALLCWLRAVRCSARAAQLASTTATARNLLVQALDWLLVQVDSVGNLPSRVDGALSAEANPLVQFCHGAPGAAIVFAFAAQELQVEQYRDAAVRFGEVTYEYGLLRKGPGLCHGIAGNGWVMLSMLRLTAEPVWLVRACQFAHAIRSEAVRGMSRTPDRPWSLFEGRAGALAFFAALCEDDPAAARFPFFEAF